MARPKLRSPDQPRIVRFVLGVVEGLASLYLAVVVITLSAVVLGWATFVESAYGTEVVRFAVYQAWWFKALLAVLGINVAAAALIRYPWKRYQTGFVITHSGILVLLAGCLLSSLYGIDAQMPIFEGQAGRYAFEDSQHIALSVYRDKTSAPEEIRVPFAAGPFNWSEYGERFWFPWRLARRDTGVLYDRGGIKLEVLNYLSDSQWRPAPPLRLRVAEGVASQSQTDWASVDLEASAFQRPDDPHGGMSLRNRHKLAQGGRIIFWAAADRAETDAFLHSQPNPRLLSTPQVVFYARGKSIAVAVSELEKRSRNTGGTGGRYPLDDSGLAVELVEPLSLDGRLMGGMFQVHAEGDPQSVSGRMLVFGGAPDLSQHDLAHGVYATFWPAKGDGAEQPAAGSAGDLGEPRIDILQSPSGKLYYRTWDRSGSVATGPVPGRQTRLTVLAETAQPVSFYVERFIAQDRPGLVVAPAAFSKKSAEMKKRQARLRLTVDGRSEEFWLEGKSKSVLEDTAPQGRQRFVDGRGRRVRATLNWDQVDVGFKIYLRAFQRKLDPGTAQASHYASLVDILDRQTPDDRIAAVVAGEDERLRLDSKLLITLNEPVNITDPVARRSYRIYQESFSGPVKPGDATFDALLGGRILPGETRPREELFVSTLTVNYDPGRGLKYGGSLLIVAGIATMFYMRAYFFRPQHAATAAP